MAENSSIEWTHHTFNPWTGCTAVSAACDNCYAEAWAKRSGHVQWGQHGQRRRTKTWGAPIKWNRRAADAGTRFRVFCASLADVFDNHRSIEHAWRCDLWALIDQTPNLDWLLLTKRPQNIVRFVPERWFVDGIPPNVWLGTTVENQAQARLRIPHLVQCPAPVRFLSCEPLQGPVRIVRWQRQLEWVIVGGESGNGFREMQPEWARSLRDQCAAANIPFLFKQWSGRTRAEIKAKGRALDGVVHDAFPSSSDREAISDERILYSFESSNVGEDQCAEDHAQWSKLVGKP